VIKVGARLIDRRALIAYFETVPVLSCFLSFAYVLLATMQLRTVLGAMWDKAANEIMADSDDFKDDSPDELILTVLRLSIYITFFCHGCLRVVWPRLVKGEFHSIVLITEANVCRMLIKFSEKNTETCWLSPLFWCGVWVACIHRYVWPRNPGVLLRAMRITIFHRGGIGYPQFILVVALLNFPWVYSYTLCILVQLHYDKHKAHFHYGLIIAAAVVALEAAFVVLEGSFDFRPERLFGLFLSCCLAVLISRRLLAPVLKSGVSLSVRVWSASTEAPERFQRVGRKAWVWVSGLCSKVGSAGRRT